MQLNWKVIIVGGILMYLTWFVVGYPVGLLIHEGVLDELYQSTAEFWLPALNQDPPDMAAVMPRWIATGLLMAIVWAGIYDNIRSAFGGPAIVRGLKFGLLIAVAYALFGLSYSGVFNLPYAIWGWWAVEGFILYPLGGIVLGWFAGKYGNG